MDRNTRLVRTPKGEDELKLRTHQLGRNERMALILVDGRSTLEQVLAKAAGSTQVETALDTLAAGGFVAAIAPGASGGYADLKRQIIGVAQEVFGDKSAKVVAKIESSRESMDGLAEGILAARKIAQLVIDEGKAKVFATRCEQLIGTH